MRKKVYLKTAEVVTKPMTQVLELETDFVQVYTDKLLQLDVSKTALQLLLYMGSLMDLNNKVRFTVDAKVGFSDQVKVSTRSVTYTVAELVASEAVVRVNRGVYIVNPLYVWKGKAENRFKAVSLYDSYIKKPL